MIEGILGGEVKDGDVNEGMAEDVVKKPLEKLLSPFPEVWNMEGR